MLKTTIYDFWELLFGKNTDFVQTSADHNLFVRVNNTGLSPTIVNVQYSIFCHPYSIKLSQNHEKYLISPKNVQK